MNAYKARPNRIPWPPLLLIGLTAAAFLANWLMPVPLEFAASKTTGAVLISLALGVDIWAMRTLYEARTTILPHRGSEHLVSQGPFRFSRNPIYVSNMALMAGLGLLIGNGWLVLLAPIDGLLTHFLAVRREERHLIAKFGYEYESYCRRVRRWI